MRVPVLVLLASSTFACASVGPQAEPTTLPASAGAPRTADDGPTYGTFGVDVAGMDRSVAPGDDFTAYAGGTWLRATEIPADRSRYGMFLALQDLSLQRTRAILEEAEAQPGSAIGAFYASFLDEAAADRKGVAPLGTWFAAIAAAPDKAALAAEFGRLQRAGVETPFAVAIGQDDKEPDAYIAGLSQSGLGLPDRDYYLKDDPKLVEIRTAYAAYLARMLALAELPDAEPRAAAVAAFEAGLARAHWTRIDSRDADKIYNKWTRADFDARAPGFPWTPYLAALGLDAQPTFLVAQPSAIAAEAALVAETSLAVLKDYLLLRTLTSYARFLSTPLVDASFHFQGTVLLGTPENEPRWKRGVNLVSDLMGEAVGKVYVQRHFTPETKAAADVLVRNLITAFGRRLHALSWMAPETRKKALTKLAAFTPKIGYPDTWRDYSALAIAADDLVGNVTRAEEFEFQRNLAKLGRPIDRAEWGMPPMMVNAYASFGLNEIVFPAAILQPPFFDPRADPAVNYGGIGAVIGHEISHHFDDQGRKYDASGRLADWWTPEDVARFTTFTERIVTQYDAYEPLPGQHVQGALTLGENIADLAGVTVAHEAYLLSLAGQPAPVLDGFTGDQRFYLGWAQVWRTKYREQQLRKQLLSDPHSPAQARTSVVRNMDAWYAAFGARPGEALYLAPDERVQVW